MIDIRGTGRYFIFVTLFFTGAAVMVIELMGTRVLAPFYGTSLYVWSSLITVALVALSIGYSYGGRIADISLKEDGKADAKSTKDAADRLYHLIFLAGIFVMIIPLVAPTVLKVTSGMGIKIGALASALILFTVPLIILGMVTPYAIKLLTVKLKVVGTTAGNLFSISTVGSVGGSLVTGFLLMPNIGAKKIFYLQAGLLIALSTAWILLSKRYGLAVTAIPFVLACLSGTMASAKKPEAEGFRVVDQRESFYGQLKVIDKGNKRWLSIDGAGHTGIRTDTGLSLNPYAYYLEILNYIRPSAEKALVVGLGGGSVTKRFEERYGVNVDSVEIDDKVVSLARQYFGFDVAAEKVYIQDGRTYILNTKKKYDFVILDAFVGGDAPPFHLLTKEMFAEIKSVLKEGGILGINILAFREGKGTIIPLSVNRTLAEVYESVRSFNTDKKGNFGNIILLASDGDLKLSKKIENCEIEGVCQILKEMMSKEVEYPRNKGVVISDDYNPLDSWGVMVSESMRKTILKFMPKEVLI